MNNIIEINGVRYSYNNGEEETVDVLKGITTTIKKGEFIAILGHNGCGKSTIAKNMNAIIVPNVGEVLVNGIKTSDEDRLNEIRQHVGMVFQNPDNQIVATIVEEDVAFALENIGVEPNEMRIRVDEALKSVGMYEYKDHTPSQLSGGQKQRVAIAGIIAMRPECIILDEPTAMLDPKGRKEVIKTVKKLNKDFGITIILITHYMEEAAEAERIIVMESGEVIMDNEPKKVFSEVEKMKEIGLDVPQVTEFMYGLQKIGFETKKEIIAIDECVEEVKAILEREKFDGNN